MANKLKLRACIACLAMLGGMAGLVLSWSPAATAQGRPTFGEPAKVLGKRFVQDGRELILNGINYFPAYFPAIMPRSWLRAGVYRPEMIEDDLTTLEKLGLNMVSIQSFEGGAVPSAQDCANLGDFLGRAQSHGLLVNLHIGVGSLMPIADPQLLATIPRACALSGHPALFAYDIAWEPYFGREATRRKLEPRWLKWLETAYGNSAGVVMALGGDRALPTDEELCSAQPNVKVSAFRRFLDDVLSASYRDARTAIRAADPSHLIGVRSGYGGNGSAATCAIAPVDLRAGVRHLDFVSPEAWSLPRSDREGLINRGGFTTAYADVGKPVFWSEYGINTNGSCSTCTEEAQSRVFAETLEMIRKSGSNGGAAWWYAGVRSQSAADSEKSDFGIIHDYVKFPSSIDAFGNLMRNGILAVCASDPGRLALTRSSSSNAGAECASGMKPRGRFRQGSDTLSLCGVDDSVVLAVTRDDAIGETATCPAGYGAVGSFKPGSVTADGSPVAVDAAGQAIKSGWLSLCTRNRSTLLIRAHNEMSGRSLACPGGYSEIGRFRPQSLPVFRPVVQQISGALSDASAARRNYTAWVTVDRDAAAGDWKMYETGIKAYAAAASGGDLIGVRTACAASTSKRVDRCVGNTRYNGACPPKCLNAEWNSVQIMDASGVWQAMSDNNAVTVKIGQPVRVRLAAGNTGEAKWLTNASAGGAAGSVRFGCNEHAGDIACRHEIASDVPGLSDAESGEFIISRGVTTRARVAFQMVSERIAWFGERITLTLVPQ